MKNFTLPDPFPHIYQFEMVITYKQLKTFLDKYWHYTIYIAIIYVISIHYLKYYMKSRPAFNLKYLTICWNAIFALFSICCTIRAIPILHYGFKHVPFYQMICNSALYRKYEGAIFWACLYLFSKVFELGDTLLIVLRKRKLLFLHWYHHMATLIAIWYGAHRELVFGYMLCYINTVVHAFMYSYFVLKFMGIKVSKKFSMFVTSLQIIQMLYEFLVILWVYWLLLNNYECDAPKDVLEYMFLICFSYLLLFIHLFHTSYLKPLHTIKKNL